VKERKAQEAMVTVSGVGYRKNWDKRLETGDMR
jgi:hypothetical protein